MSQKLGRNALLALGMHRSGTSALTGMLGQLGVQLGRQLYAPQQGVNEKGFFEHSGITDSNDHILLATGSAWDDILPLIEGWQQDSRLDKYKDKLRRHIRRDFNQAALWGLKDPRICRLLPLWKSLLAEEDVTVRYLLIFRHPMEVAQSLARRDGFSVDKALLLWLDHNLQAEYHTRGKARIVTRFDELLAHPIAQLQRLQTRLELDFPTPIAQASDTIQAFLSPGLRHHAATDMPDDSPLADLALKVYEALSAAATSAEGEPDSQVMDRAKAGLDAYRAVFPDLLVEQLRSIGQQRGEAQVMVERVFGSWSWELGKPWRFLERLMGGDI